jgi:hypothetical protein
MLKSRGERVAAVLFAAGLLGALAIAFTYPAVEGIGTLVRLPVFHGALTWVILLSFSAMALVAFASLLRSSETLYRWAEALRWVAVPMWAVSSVLGLLSAFQTWDFTGSKSTPLTEAGADAKLMATFWILIAALAVVAIGLILADRLLLSLIDIAFVILMWTAILRADEQGLHPDNPVMNSGEFRIKALFFAMAGLLALATGSVVWLVKRARTAALAARDAEKGPEE